MNNRLLALTLVASLPALAAAAWAEDLPPGYGVFTPSGSTFTTEISQGGDSDDYVFEGYPGMALSFTVKPAKGSALVPELILVRPGGSIATDEDGLRVSAKGTSRTGTMTLDSAGWWQIRVRGVDLDPTYLGVDRSFGSYSISVKYGSPSIPALPVVSKSLKVNGAIDVKGDIDEYRFQGYPGQTVAGTLKAASTLIPRMELIRPDGTVAVGDAGVTQKKTTFTFPNFTMDQQGTWSVRIVGLEPTPDPDPNTSDATVGTYSLQVKLGKVGSTPSILPDDNDQYRFTIPAGAGTTIGFTLNFTGSAPTLNSLLDPSGAAVAGFNGQLTVTSKSLAVSSYVIPAGRPTGNYLLTFDAPATPPTGVSFVPRLTIPKGVKGRKATLSKDEPVILNTGINPTAGGTGTLVVVGTNGKLVDSNDDDVTKLKMYLNHVPLTGVTLTNTSLRGTVPAGLALGTYDVVVESTTGQVGVKAGSFQVVAAPKANAIDPTVGTDAGGFPITITGAGFRPGRVGIHIDGALVPVQITATTDTTVTFVAPPRSPTTVTFGVFDTETQLSGNLAINSFEYVGTAAISRIVPSLTTILGGDEIFVKGSRFETTDHVFLETSTAGVYQEMTPGTYVDSGTHKFTAPPRPKGVYRVYVTNQFGQPNPPRTRNLTYFQFSNLMIDPTTLPSGSDQWDGVTNAVADFDLDGFDDLFISRLGGGSLASAPQTRALKNDGTGHFADVTGGANPVIPPVTSSDDWRANRIWASDINLDGYPDLVLTTNDTSALPSTRSHTRILLNEPLTGASALPRVFRDRTVDLLPAVRTSSQLYGGGGNTVVDNWRGLDMWVGDVDKGGPAPPEILITHKELKEELDVGCGNYCASPYSSGYTYGFYWGGSRALVWNKAANAGQGKYKFEHNFFPRKAGVRVNIFNPPNGVTIPICNSSYGQPCRGKFTPFTGKRIAVGDVNADGKPDIGVLSDDTVSKDGAATSSLQVGINRFNPADGALITDVTGVVNAIGGSFQGDTVEIGQPGYPDGNSFGVFVITKAAGTGGGSVLRVIKYKPSIIVGEVAAFEDITQFVMPATSANDKWQASRIAFRDVDTDGDQDMILVANTPPGGADPAFRVLRNEIVNQKVGVFRETLKGIITPIVTANEHLEGEFMSIGDVNKDGSLDYILTRATTTSPAPQTRIIITDK